AIDAFPARRYRNINPNKCPRLKDMRVSGPRVGHALEEAMASWGKRPDSDREGVWHDDRHGRCRPRIRPEDPVRSRRGVVRPPTSTVPLRGSVPSEGAVQPYRRRDRTGRSSVMHSNNGRRNMRMFKSNGDRVPAVIESLAESAKAGKSSRREFLAMASVMGASAAMAYGML